MEYSIAQMGRICRGSREQPRTALLIAEAREYKPFLVSERGAQTEDSHRAIGGARAYIATCGAKDHDTRKLSAHLREDVGYNLAFGAS